MEMQSKVKKNLSQVPKTKGNRVVKTVASRHAGQSKAKNGLPQKALLLGARLTTPPAISDKVPDDMPFPKGGTRALSRKSFDEILRPIRRDIQKRGITEEEVDSIVRRARRKTK